MTTITAVETITPESAGKAKIYIWETITSADDGSAVNDGDFTDRSVQVVGTFGGETISIQGSNDGTNWVTLKDLHGAALTFAVAGLKGIAEVSRYLRPLGDGSGTGTDLDVYLFTTKLG